jgi:hypothetical protein
MLHLLLDLNGFDQAPFWTLHFHGWTVRVKSNGHSFLMPQLSTIHGGCLMSSEFELTRLVGYSKAETENEIRRVADSLGTAPASNTRGC